MQEVVLDRNIRLLDSPGVVFDDHSAFLGNCIDVASMDDPIPAISQLLKRCRLPTLLMLYNIPAFAPSDNVDMFLALIAKRHGRVLRGGIPDKMAAARSVLQDWNCGKIPYFTVPPVVDKTAHVEQDAVVVSSFGKEFDLQALDDAVLNDHDHDANAATSAAAGTASTGTAASSKEMDAMDYLQLSNPTDEKMPAAAGTTRRRGVSSQEAVDILMGTANSDDDDDDDCDVMEEEEEDDDDDDEEQDEDVAPSKTRSRKQLAKAEDYDFSDL
jgi:hypothetical protein